MSARISSSKIEVSTEKAFTLDGSDSKDLDLAAESPQGLSFRWTCTLFDESMIEHCRDTTGALLNLEEAAKVKIDKGMLAPTIDNPYTFTLTVSKGQKLPQSTSVSVVVLNRYVPTLNVRTSTARVRSDGSKMINFRDKVVLEGVCEDESASLEWFISP
ncbi:MAG: REJ domain-containing protein, partial [bacterium]